MAKVINYNCDLCEKQINPASAFCVEQPGSGGLLVRHWPRQGEPYPGDHICGLSCLAETMKGYNDERLCPEVAA